MVCGARTVLSCHKFSMLFPVRAGVQIEVGAPQIGLSLVCCQTQLRAAFEMNESRTDPAFATYYTLSLQKRVSIKKSS